MSHHIIPCHIISCYIISCHIISYRTMSCHIILYHVTSHDIMLYHVLQCHIKSNYITLYCRLVYHIQLYYIISYHVLGGEIIEVNGGVLGGKGGGDLTHSQPEVLLYSHSGGELWGSCVHPSVSDLYVTVGDDGTLRVWSIRMNRMVYSLYLGWAARCVCFHPTGNVLGVGFMESVKGGAKKERKKEKEGEKDNKDKEDDIKNIIHNGAVHLYSFIIDNNNNYNHNKNNIIIKMEKISDGCTTTAWVNEIKFSPSGKILAIGSHDKKMYFYDIPNIPNISNNSNENLFGGNEWVNCMKKTKFVFDKHSSAVLHSDFTLDGKYLQTDSQVRYRRYGMFEYYYSLKITDFKMDK